MHKRLNHYLYVYVGHICPIQALHTYMWVPYICLKLSFGCFHLLCILHIAFWHVARCYPTSY